MPEDGETAGGCQIVLAAITININDERILGQATRFSEVSQRCPELRLKRHTGSVS